MLRINENIKEELKNQIDRIRKIAWKVHAPLPTEYHIESENITYYVWIFDHEYHFEAIPENGEIHFETEERI